MNMSIAAAGFAEIPEGASHQFESTSFLFSLAPVILYFVGITLFWVSVNWSGLRQRHVSDDAQGALAVLCLPGIMWLILIIASRPPW